MISKVAIVDIDASDPIGGGVIVRSFIGGCTVEEVTVVGFVLGDGVREAPGWSFVAVHNFDTDAARILAR